MQRPRNEIFFTSIHEINRLIEERGDDDEDPETAELIDKNLPPQYSEYRDVFSKTESNRLPPHREYDHVI